ncbi:MAG: NAD-dependent epimerase/dehydratase family protein [Polyangiales bacterium]
MSKTKALVLGASGFLGSHVVMALANAGRPVRILTRQSSNTSMTDHLDIERRTGDVFDPHTLREAMEGCSTVFYCIVDARSWLRDSTPLFKTNVEGSRTAIDMAAEVEVDRFVFTSSIVTIGLNPSGKATERDAFNWEHLAPAYVRSRVAAEKQLLERCATGFPGIVCNVATTFGPHDHQPTPHGDLVKRTVEGTMPVYWNAKMSVVGIEDAANAMLLAETRGVVGERYIIADRMMDMKEITTKTAAFANAKRPQLRIPMWALKSGVWSLEKLTHAFGRDTVLSMSSILLMETMGDFDNTKARTELGWNPRPMDDSLRDAVVWFQGRVSPSFASRRTPRG